MKWRKKLRYYETCAKASRLLAWRLQKQQSENTVYRMWDSYSKKNTYELEGIQKAFEKFHQGL